jgi:hypothetical protein
MVCKLKITNEKFQPTNNNVSEFTNNKTHASIAKLQVYKFTSLQICKLQNKSQVTNYKFTNYNIIVKNLEIYNMTILHSYKLHNWNLQNFKCESLHTNNFVIW